VKFIVIVAPELFFFLFVFFAGVSFHSFFTALLDPIGFVLGWFSKRHLGPLRPAPSLDAVSAMSVACQCGFKIFVSGLILLVLESK
jgi:hypothetical protein